MSDDSSDDDSSLSDDSSGDDSSGDDSSDDDSVPAAAASAGRGRRQQRQQPPAVLPIESLLDEERWDEARKRINRLSSRKRIGKILYYAADDPGVPANIFEALFAKLRESGGGEKYDEGDFNPSCLYELPKFWNWLCSYKVRTIRGWRRTLRHPCPSDTKTFQLIIGKLPAASLRVFLEEFVHVFGRLQPEYSCKLAKDLWHFHFPPTSSQGDREATEQELFSVTSLADLRLKPATHNLWLKTELLIGMSLEGGMGSPVLAENPSLIHLLLKLRVPKVVVWLAAKLYPASLNNTDEGGSLPLHVVIRGYRFTEVPEGFIVRYSEGFRALLGEDMDKFMFNLFPAAAGRTDSRGAYPLALLLGGSRPYNRVGWWALRQLALAFMKQAPKALLRRSTENFLFPFMSAAVLSSFTNETPMLSLTYELLRENPSALSKLGTVPRSQLLYVEEKLEDAKSKIERLEEENLKLRLELTAALKKSNEDPDKMNDVSLSKGRAKRSRRT